MTLSAYFSTSRHGVYYFRLPFLGLITPDAQQSECLTERNVLTGLAIFMAQKARGGSNQMRESSWLSYRIVRVFRHNALIGRRNAARCEEIKKECRICRSWAEQR